MTTNKRGSRASTSTLRPTPETTASETMPKLYGFDYYCGAGCAGYVDSDTAREKGEVEVKRITALLGQQHSSAFEGGFFRWQFGSKDERDAALARVREAGISFGDLNKTEWAPEAPTATTEGQAVEMLDQGVQQVIGPQPEMTTAAPAPKAEEKAKRPTGMMASLKELVFTDSKLSVDDLIAKLKEAGFSPSKSSVQTIRADFLHSLRICHFLGVKGLTKFVRE